MISLLIVSHTPFEQFVTGEQLTRYDAKPPSGGLRVLDTLNHACVCVWAFLQKSSESSTQLLLLQPTKIPGVQFFHVPNMCPQSSGWYVAQAASSPLRLRCAGRPLWQRPSLTAAAGSRGRRAPLKWDEGGSRRGC